MYPSLPFSSSLPLFLLLIMYLIFLLNQIVKTKKLISSLSFSPSILFYVLFIYSLPLTSLMPLYLSSTSPIPSHNSPHITFRVQRNKIHHNNRRGQSRIGQNRVRLILPKKRLFEIKSVQVISDPVKTSRDRLFISYSHLISSHLISPNQTSRLD